MGKHKEKKDFDEIVQSHVGKYVYNLQNPVSRGRFAGKGGQMYRLVYAVNPLKSGTIDRIAIPDDAVELLRDYSQVVIRPNGEIRAIKDNSNGATLGWLIYKIPARYIVHLDGNPLNFRRENIHDNRKMVNRGMAEKGYWDMSFVGSTRALISLIIRDNPNQSWEELVATVADIKGVPMQEAERRLKEFAAADMLGYHMRETYWDGNAYQEVGEWIAYEEKEID